uniref:Polyamine-transporting ATPase 13A3 n=1 Tax=Paramormyrops kingsleyae TaxID=1676925 RepID=A0A3B3TD30_9TELE|nr:probable cation-transporting ATPase 13A3 isoform X3 [Paramormyrops kingsleyae]
MEKERWREMEKVGFQLVNRGEEEEMEVCGFVPSPWRICLLVLGCVLSGGLLALLLLWVPQWSVRWACVPAPLPQASVLLLRTTDEFGRYFRVRIKTLQIPHMDPPGMGVASEGAGGVARDGAGGVAREQAITEDCGKGPQEHALYWEVRCFHLQSVTYMWNSEARSYQPLDTLDHGIPIANFYSLHSRGLSASRQENRRLFYGINQIEVKVPSVPNLLVKEVLNPFYIFQVFSVILWSLDDYYYYASAIFLMSLLSVCTSLYTVRKHYILLHDMVSAHNVIRCSVYRGDQEVEEILSTDLVPGDVIIIPSNGMMMPCDAALIGGTCIVNESMLTGESVPVTKTQLPLPPSGGDDDRLQEPAYDPEEHRRHTLFCGTQVIQTRYYSGESVKAVVVRTGFSTVKGQLVRSILYPKPSNFQLYRDAVRFLLGLVCVAAVGVAYSIYTSASQGESVGRIVLEALDIITITVPPALPAAMTAGIVYAQHRLRRTGIFCTSPHRINTCGQVNLVCFDKTGTLTEDGLDLWGIQRVEDSRFTPPEQEMAEDVQAPSHFLVAMASCHSLTRIEGRLAGDPLDIKMFEATGWDLEEPSPDETSNHDLIMPTVVRPAKPPPGRSPPCQEIDQDIRELMGRYEVGVLAQFPFSSTLQRMSVVTRVLGERRLQAYLKGAPETVVSLCQPDTVPPDFWEVLDSYTRQGLRVIALAHRQLEPKFTWHRLHITNREAIECEMKFLGLLMLQNKLKPQTVPVLAELHQAHIRTIMVTGDSMLTAVSVARECGLIPPHTQVIITEAQPSHEGQPATVSWSYSQDSPYPMLPPGETQVSLGTQQNPPRTSYHFAMSGRTFAIILEHFSELLPKLLLCGTVYARMAPDQKTQLVEELQKVDYYVAMCGDGANDCGALKRAHAGISLSELEASVASPFTSRTPDISCVPHLIREGRAALVTSFCVFKFMALYSIIQYLCVLLLYSILSNMGDSQYLFIDIAIIMSLAFTMSLSPAWKQLVAQHPPSTLLAPPLLLSVVGQILLALSFQTATFLLADIYAQNETQPSDWLVGNTTGMTTNGSRPVSDKDEKDSDNIENLQNTSLFFVSGCQYLTVALVFNRGPPFRQPLYTNYLFMLCIVFCYGFLIVNLLHPVPALQDFFQLVFIPMEWRVTLLGLIIANLILAFTLESFITDFKDLWNRSFARQKLDEPHPDSLCPQMEVDGIPSPSRACCCHSSEPPRARYQRLAQQLLLDPDWPPPPSTKAKPPTRVDSGAVQGLVPQTTPL